MADEPDRIARNLAENLAQARKRQGLSQAELARLADLPRSTLTHLESGSGNPSLRNLMKLAAALQLSLEELLSGPRPSTQLIRKSELPVRKRAQGMALAYKLLPDPIPGMEFDRFELQPGARMGGIPHLAQTKEYLACIQGVIEVHTGGEKHPLEPGDVLAFPGDQPHSYINPGRSLAICISVVVMARQ